MTDTVCLEDWVLRFASRGDRTRPALFLDRDGTLIENIPYLCDPSQVAPLPGAAEAIRAYRARGFAIVIVSNQSGIARGLCSREAYLAVTRRMLALPGFVEIDAVYACPFLPDGQAPFDLDHAWRKPADGMLRAAAADLNLDLSKSIMVGDSLVDMQAGAAAGVHGLVHVATGHGAKHRAAVIEGFTNIFRSRLLLVENLAGITGRFA